MTLVLAKDFVGLEGSLGQTDIVYNEQGTSWSAVNPEHEVLFVWIVTLSGVNVGVARIDGRGHDDNPIIVPASLGTASGIEGIRCCYNPATDGWVIAYNIGTAVSFKLFDHDLAVTITDTSLPNAMPAGSTAASFNLGCDDSGNIFISWPGRIFRINSSNASIDKNVIIDGGNRLHVNEAAGTVDVTRMSGDNLVVDRYDADIVLQYSVVAASCIGIDPKAHAITGRYNDGGFAIAFVYDQIGDNLRYRAFDSSGSPLYGLRTLAGTGHIDITSNQARLFFCTGQRPQIDDQQYTYVIRATSTNASSNRVIALIEPQNFNPQTIDKEEFTAFSDSDARYGQPSIAVSQYEIRSMKPSFGGTPAMDLEVYVRQSVWMSLWRIEENARVFVDNTLDPDGRTNILNIYQNYPAGSRFAGETGTHDAQYTATNGRDTVNPNTTSFSSYWGSTTTEDNVFIGGPVMSEIAQSFETNPNCFDAQITTLASELGFSALEYFIINRTKGWGTGTQAPEVRVTVGGNTYNQQRHTLPNNVYYQQSTAADIYADYGIIVRLPLTANSTQSSRAFIYVAGINAMGTEAAAYVYRNPLQFKLGASSAFLVVLEYDNALQEPALYTAGVTGNIRVYPLSMVSSHDYEGIR